MRLTILALSMMLVACTKEKTVDSTFPEGNQSLSTENGDCVGEAINNEFIVRWENGETTLVRAPNTENFKTEFLEPQLPAIRRVEYNKRYSLHNPSSDFAKLDADFDAYANWGLDMIGAQKLQDQGHFGQNMVVAVIDTGVDTSHPQLANNIYTNPLENKNGLDDDNNGFVDDIHGYDFVNSTGTMQDGNGHGTHVSGVIVAEHDVGTIKGVAPQSKIMPLRFLDSSGEGDLISAIGAIEYARDNGAKIINASWGGPGCSQLLKSTIETLNDKGVLFIAASGNSNKDLDEEPLWSKEYPASFTIDAQIVVGASTPNDRVVQFSNIGVKLVNIIAPGFQILSTYPNYDKVLIDGGNERFLSGTSMAAPYVSGAAALLWSKYPDANYLQIKEALLEGVSGSPDKGFPYPVSSEGRLDIEAADSYLDLIL